MRKKKILFNSLKYIIRKLYLILGKIFPLVNIWYFCLSNKSREKKVKYSKNEVLIGIWDFNASPYAIGDILTWNMRLNIQAINTNKKIIDICIIADPKKPSNSCQTYITSTNYHKYLLELIPVFYLNPLLRDLHIFQSREEFDKFFALKKYYGYEFTPDLYNYMKDYFEALALYTSHDIINDFYKKNGFVPQFKKNLFFCEWAKNFFCYHKTQNYFVCVHLRQRQNSASTIKSGDTVRDAIIEHWLDFFNIMEKKYPEVMFIVIGRIVEFPRELFTRSNIIVLKTLGHGLYEELAMIQECDMFMGSNSGPAVMAEFGSKPYIIFQVSDASNSATSANLWGINIGDEKLPFAKENQKIKWDDTSIDFLVSSFEEIYLKIRKNYIKSI